MTRYALPLAAAVALLSCLVPAVCAAAPTHSERVCPRTVVRMVDGLDRVETAVQTTPSIAPARYRALVDAVALPLPAGLTSACEDDVLTPAATADFDYLRAIVDPKGEKALWAKAAHELTEANGPLEGHV